MPFHHTNRFIYGPDLGTDYWHFDDIEGALQPKMEQIQTLVRLGRHGERMRYTGVRARPSTVRTIAYVDNRQLALDLAGAYTDMINGQLIEVIQHSQSFGYFRVQGFQMEPLRAVENVVGYIARNPPAIMQTIRWQLLGGDLFWT